MTKLRGAYSGPVFHKLCRECGKCALDEQTARTEAAVLTQADRSQPKEAYFREGHDGWHTGAATRDRAHAKNGLG
jgi:hypothetical protein